MNRLLMMAEAVGVMQPVKAVAPLTYVFRDEFTTDLAAGAVNGSAAEPGPGVRTVTDTTNKLALSGGVALFTGRNAAGDPGYWTPQLSNVIGRTILSRSKKINSGIQYLLATSAVASGAPSLFAHRISGNTLTIWEAGTVKGNIGSITYDTFYQCVLVGQGSAGEYFIIKGGTEFPEWTVTWVSRVSQVAAYYASFSGGTNQTLAADYIKVADLAAPFNTQYGLATQRLAGHRAEGDSFTHEANFLMDWTATTLANGQQVIFRAQDANNYWRVDTAADGSIALQEVVAGAATSRGTAAAGSIANGQRMVVLADGQIITIFANSLLVITYSSAANFATETAGNLLALGAGGAIDDIISWPRVLSGEALKQINRMVQP